jgi:hypothetical protein
VKATGILKLEAGLLPTSIGLEQQVEHRPTILTVSDYLNGR